MKKIATLNLILLCSFFIAHAQLNKLCPISSTVYDKKKDSGYKSITDH